METKKYGQSTDTDDVRRMHGDLLDPARRPHGDRTKNALIETRPKAVTTFCHAQNFVPF